MTRRRAIAYGILFAAATSLWFYTHSERAQVRRVFDDIERLAAKEPGESVMECAAKSKSLAEHFGNGCSVIDLAHGLDATYSRENIAGGLLAFRPGRREPPSSSATLKSASMATKPASRARSTTREPRRRGRTANQRSRDSSSVSKSRTIAGSSRVSRFRERDTRTLCDTYALGDLWSSQ